MARPHKLTSALQNRICEAIRAGNFFEVAAKFGGISEKTFHRWMARGRKAASGRYFEFAQAVEKAEHDAEVALVALWRKSAAEDWQAARSLLERRHRDRWGRKAEVDVKGDLSPQSNVVICLPPEDEPIIPKTPKTQPDAAKPPAADRSEAS